MKPFYTYNFKLIRVIDGDTIDVSIDLGFSIWKKERVRIADIDAPESITSDHNEKAYGMRAKSMVKAWFSDREDFVIKTELDDKYGRCLGYIFSGEDCLNDYLLGNKYVWKYDGGKKIKNFSELDPLV